MANLNDLIKFIESSPGEDVSWGDWKTELSRSIPNWKSMIADPQNWDVIEKSTPLKWKTSVFGSFIEVGGFELAKRWFHSHVVNQREAAKDWLTKDTTIDESTWQACDRDMKNTLLEHRFERWPGEPFEMFEKYKRELRYIVHRLDREGPPDANFRAVFDQAIRSLPYIGGYVPSPQIEKLRFVIADAGDTEYLTRIDEMISRREKACESISFQQPHRIPYTPNGNERELIARVMEITGRSGYLPTALPPIFVSSETPPIFISYPELENDDEDEYQRTDEDQIPRNWERRRPETISIEELLGVYQSRHEQIVIYERGIKWRGHRCDEEWLRSVVLIHEISHWITHVLPKPGVPTWSTDLFALSETDLKEGWAQLITWWIADQVGGSFKDTFEKLNQNQSPPYHIFERFKDEPIDKVMASLERLRLLPWPARLQDWKRTLI